MNDCNNPPNYTRRLLKWLGLTAAIAALTCLSAIIALRFVPLPKTLFQPVPARIELTDRNGTPLRHVRPADGPFIRPVSLTEIPAHLVHATLAAEDKRFWRHPGVDWRAYARATWHLLRYRRVVSGGSTITQQLIKLAEPRPRTFRTKLIEALQALRLEQVWDKQRILTEYLNRLDYGNLNTGCAAAAEFYYGRPLSQLSPAQSALLAGLPQAPTRLNPVLHPDRARKRQRWILQQMRENGFLTPDELSRALAESTVIPASGRAFEAPHFAELLLASLPEAAPAEGSIQTTLHLPLNRFVQETIRSQLAALSSRHVQQAAAVVIDNPTGEVLALVGSKDYFAHADGQVNGAWAPRSAGSTFKPFTYLIAWESGANPATIVADIPANFPTPTGVFSPVNYDRHCYGPMRHRLALANSLNISAVKVLDSIGGPAVLQERLQTCGLTTLTDPPERYGLGLTIGNAEARLLELANAYACLARLGEYRPFKLVHGAPACSRLTPPADPSGPNTQNATARDFTSGAVVRAKPTGSRRSGIRVFDRATAFLLADVLSDNNARAWAFGPDSQLRFNFPVACKTGTSSDFRDNWAFAYTPEFTVGVWVGNFDGTPMAEVSGISGAAPIMRELMQHLHDRCGTSWFTPPPEILQCAIDPITGKRVVADPDSQPIEFFHRDHLPEFQTAADFDTEGRIRLPPEYRDWLASSDNWLGSRAIIDSTASTLRIEFPVPGTVLYLDADLPDGGRRLPLECSGGETAVWTSGTLQCATNENGTFALLKQGRHRLQARDPGTGATRDTWIEVLPR